MAGRKLGSPNLDIILMKVNSYSQKSLSFFIGYTKNGYFVTLREPSVFLSQIDHGKSRLTLSPFFFADPQLKPVVFFDRCLMNELLAFALKWHRVQR